MISPKYFLIAISRFSIYLNMTNPLLFDSSMCHAKDAYIGIERIHLLFISNISKTHQISKYQKHLHDEKKSFYHIAKFNLLNK